MNGFVQTLDNDFKSWHPRECQMTVLKKDPASLSFSIVNHSLCFLSLTLAQRDHFSSSPHVLFLCKGLEVLNWIGTSTQYEDKWGNVRRILIAWLDLKGRGINELFTNLFYDVGLDSLADLVWSYRFKHNHLLERVKFVVPFSW